MVNNELLCFVFVILVYLIIGFNNVNSGQEWLIGEGVFLHRTP